MQSSKILWKHFRLINILDEFFICFSALENVSYFVQQSSQDWNFKFSPSIYYLSSNSSVFSSPSVFSSLSKGSKIDKLRSNEPGAELIIDIGKICVIQRVCLLFSLTLNKYMNKCIFDQIMIRAMMNDESCSQMLCKYFLKNPISFSSSPPLFHFEYSNQRSFLFPIFPSRTEPFYDFPFI